MHDGRERLNFRRRYVLPGALTFCSVFIINGMARPYLLFREKLDSEIRRKNDTLLRYERLALQKSAAERMAREASAFRVAGSLEEESARFLKEAERLSRQASLNVHQMKPLPVIRKDSYARFTVDLELDGSMEDLMGFALAVERSKLGVRIQKLGISAAGDSDSNLTGRFTLTRLILSR